MAVCFDLMLIALAMSQIICEWIYYQRPGGGGGGGGGIRPMF